MKTHGGKNRNIPRPDMRRRWWETLGGITVKNRIQTDQDTQTMGSGTGEEGKEWTNTGRRN